MALALYRKYRSADFSEVIGQEHVTAPLMQALSAGRINHAYLFSGPRGCGKTSSARILARSLNCVQGPTPTPCGVCDSCKDLAPNGSGSIDVIEIDAASHGGVDDARDLRERAYYAPVRDRYKVYIIDEAHMVTTQGFNALLKLVEEPPEFLVFIFATTEPEKVLQTIRSRTHHYPFRLIPPSVLRAHLERICAAEGATVEPPVFPLVVRAGAGSARDSLSVLDQLLAGAGPEGVTYSRAIGLLGVTDSALLNDMVDSLAVGDAAAVYGTIDRVVEAGHDPRRFAADLLERFRDLIVLDAVPDAAEQGMIDYPADEVAGMADQSRRIGVASLVRFADIAHTTLTDMRGTTSPRLMLELLSARMLLPDASTDSAALLQRMERLERRQGMTDGSTTVGRPAQDAPAPRAASTPRRPAPEAAAQMSTPDAAPPKPETAKPETAKPAAAKPEIDKPEIDKPAAAKPEAGTPEAAEPEVASAKPEVASAKHESPAQAPQPVAPEPARHEAPAQPTDRIPEQTPTAAAPPPDAAQSTTAAQPTAQAAPSQASSAQPPPQAAPSQASSAQPPPQATVPADGIDAVGLRRIWPDVLDQVRQRSRRTRALLDNATVATVDGTLITLAASSAPIAKMIGDDSNLSVLRDALAAIVGGGWKIEVGTDPGAGFADPGNQTRPTDSGQSRGSAAPPPPREPDYGVDEDADEVHASTGSGGDAEAAALALMKTSLGARPLDER